MKMLWVVLLVLTSPVFSQDKVTLHVTSVEQSNATDYCTTGKCAATRFIVEGYTQDKDGGVQYVLECVEVINLEPSGRSLLCARLHSHAEYDATIYPDSVAFGLPSPHDNALSVNYTIKSEKEIRKK